MVRSIGIVCEWSSCAGSGIWVGRPFVFDMDTTTMNTMIKTSNTSINGVTLICGLDGPPPAENAIAIAPLQHACLRGFDTPLHQQVPPVVHKSFVRLHCRAPLVHDGIIGLRCVVAAEHA